MKIHNNTTTSLEDIQTRRLLCVVRNNWRQRNIRLYEHEDPNMVYSVGVSFDMTSVVICRETRKQWQRELNTPGKFGVIN